MYESILNIGLSVTKRKYDSERCDSPKNRSVALMDLFTVSGRVARGFALPFHLNTQGQSFTAASKAQPPHFRPPLSISLDITRLSQYQQVSQPNYRP